MNYGISIISGAAVVTLANLPVNRSMACKQEHGLQTDQWGIRVVERAYHGHDRMAIEYIPIPTAFCNFCMPRVRQGMKPACVRHCMTPCTAFGPRHDMGELEAKKKKSVVWGRTV